MRRQDITYHYTGVESGMRILATGVFHMSNPRYMNDRQEAGKAAAALEACAGRGTDRGRVAALRAIMDHTLLFCTSRNADDLNQ